MTVQIVKDGEIQGSFVATAITIFVFLMLFLGFIFEAIRLGWEKFGGQVTAIYLGQLTVWLGYRGARSIFGQPQLPPLPSLPPSLPTDVKPGPVIGPIIIEPLARAKQTDQQEIIVDLDKKEEKK